MSNKKPKIIKNENVVMFDIDETLIMHKKWVDQAADQDGTNYPWIFDARINKFLLYEPHQYHILLLKQSHARGRTNIVWSAGGHEWARMVIEQLKLNKYVDIIMTKANAYFDDKGADTFMHRVYIPQGNTDGTETK